LVHRPLSKRFAELTLCHAVRTVIEQISGPKIIQRLGG
jgi:hypothetical protein